MQPKIVGHIDYVPKRCLEYLDCRDCPLSGYRRCDNKVIDENGNIIQTGC